MKDQIEIWRIAKGRIVCILDEPAILAKFVPGRSPRINLLMQGMRPDPPTTADWISYRFSEKGLLLTSYKK